MTLREESDPRVEEVIRFLVQHLEESAEPTESQDRPSKEDT